MRPALFGNISLARRLEKAEAANALQWRSSDDVSGDEHVVLEIGGGVAAFAGPSSPLTHALGLGMQGAVSSEQLDQIESFYHERGAAVTFELCPLADPSIFDLLGRRAYRITEFNNVLVRTVDAAPENAPPRVRRAEPFEENLWARTVSEGFFERTDFTTEELRMTSMLFNMPNGVPWLAFEEARPAAAAGMSIHDRLATLFGDATMKAYRRRGLQNDLIGARIQYAGEHGCNLITASTLPGSQSQFNYERHGFRVVYTKLIMARE